MEHRYVNLEFKFGKWEGFITCLQSYICTECKKVITIPEPEILDDNSRCVKKPSYRKLREKMKRRSRCSRKKN